MITVFYSHSVCVADDPGAGHPERLEWLGAVLDALDAVDGSHFPASRRQIGGVVHKLRTFGFG